MLSHSLENALSKQIQNKNEKAANILIDLIVEDKDERLTYIDVYGQSFLHLALTYKLKTIAEKILAIHLNDAKIVSDVNCFLLADALKQTCLFLAAKQRYADIVRQLLKYSQSIQKADELGYKLWLVADENGNTPLHALAKNEDHDNKENERVLITDLLLEKYSQEDDAKFYINQINKQGDTPLHLACSKKKMDCDIGVIALLIKYGACLTIENDKKETPLQAILQLGLTEKIELLRALKNHDEKDKTRYQQELFLLFKQHALKNKQDKKIVNYFLQLALSVSLKASIQAQLDFNDVLDLDKPLVEDSPEAIFNDLVFLLLQEDREKFDHLSDEIDTKLTFLGTQDEITITSRQKTIIVTTVFVAICLLIYIPLESWLGVKSGQKDNDLRYMDYQLTALLFGLLGGMTPLITIILMATHIEFSNTYAEITHDQWKDIQDELQKIINEMQLLEAAPSTKLSDDYLREKTVLETDLEKLKEPVKKIPDLKTELGNIKNACK
jgi:ankyrin repeat protein